MPRVVYNIPENAKENVLQAMRKEKNAVVKERLLAVSMFLDGIPKGEIKKLMHRGRAYVGIWITAYFNGGVDALADNRGGDHKSLLTQEQMQLLKQIITTSYPVYAKGWDGHSVVDLIEYHFGIKYSRNGVYQVLKRLNLTHKIATKTDPKKSELKIATWKEEIKKNLIKLCSDIVLLSQDESRFSSESNHITSWSIKGVPVSYSGYRYGTSLNCFGSFNLHTGHLISSFHNTGNALTTIEHFKIVREYYGDKPIAYLIDNASWHKTKKVQEYCEENNITLLFLPPYSPEFNPIERVWGFLKSKVKNVYFSTAKKFIEFVTDLLQNINQTDKTTLLNLCTSLI